VAAVGAAVPVPVEKTLPVDGPDLYAFTDFDTDKNRNISPEEFYAGVRPLLPKKSFKKSPQTSFWNAFVSSFASIGATEVGDKTFFIAAVLSMREPRLVVFAGAFGALVVMTVLSTLMGLVLPALLPRQYTHIAAGVLFLYFGMKLLRESAGADHGPSEELEEVEGLLKKDEDVVTPNDDEEEGGVMQSPPSSGPVNMPPSSGTAKERGRSARLPPDTVVAAERHPTPRKSQSGSVLGKAFCLTFLAEWGDRSQVATIALAAAKDPIGVTLGGCLGHALCTGVAVMGGRILAARISEKTVHFWGGMTFLAFGVHSLFWE